jgi:hypothetical protein
MPERMPLDELALRMLIATWAEVNRVAKVPIPSLRYGARSTTTWTLTRRCVPPRRQWSWWVISAGERCLGHDTPGTGMSISRTRQLVLVRGTCC